jgi:hypothetical protein
MLLFIAGNEIVEQVFSVCRLDQQAIPGSAGPAGKEQRADDECDDWQKDL